MNLPENLNLNLPVKIPEQVEKAKQIVHQGFNSWSENAQQIGESWQITAVQVTDKFVNKFTATTEQAKDSLGNTFQIAIDSSFGHFLDQHPAFFKLTQIFVWGVNHPIISVIVIIFAIALIFSFIKAIVRLIESASLSIIRLPLQLLQAGLKLSFLYLNKLIKLLFIKFKYKHIPDSLSKQNINISNNQAILAAVGKKVVSSEKQQRLKEISSRLADIQEEQHQLLHEAASILNTEPVSDSDLDSGSNIDLNSSSNSNSIQI
ncbi:MAG: hypothetical protein QNJ49_10305 [Mastigocoleus sp. MO_167.B18]|nr:hypothetical protein [Mastigocoleus sp. MO_167.B18]